MVAGATLAALLELEGKTTPEAALVVMYGTLLGLGARQAVSKPTDFGIAALAGDRPVPA